MTRRLIVVLVVVTLLFVAAAPAMAGPGMPELHGVDGRTFGGLVSGLAQTDPVALVMHITGCGG